MLIVTAAMLLLAVPVAPGEEGGSLFTSEVRPILSRNCLPCHGPDAATRKADLRLDRQEDLLAVVEAGSSGDSELFLRITSEDPDDRMPPPEHGTPLTEESISTLRRWIDEGATWQDHWSFRKPIATAPPLTSPDQHPIDAFIDRRIEEAGLPRSKEAIPEVLVRRLHLDLIGLPPDPQRVTRFVTEYQDDPESTWQQLIEELLESDAFGERWASVWLDLARYADTKGFEQDGNRNIWPWRDWVIQAFDADMPFDQFTIEQLAGDLLPDRSQANHLATAFHRNTMTNDEGGTQNEEFRVAAVVDRVNTTMQVWQGLTANCAQCHDHKYDPLTQKEYYQLYDFFNQTSDADLNNEHPVISVLGILDRELVPAAEEKVEETLTRLDEAARELVIPDQEQPPVDSSTLDVIAFSGQMPPLCQDLVDGQQKRWPWVPAPEDAPEQVAQIISQSAPAGQTRQVYFEKSLHPHIAAEGDTYIVNARILEPPESMILQVRLDDATVWEHRGYWGAAAFSHGVDGSPSLLRQGDLPTTGDWVQLQVAAASIGIEAGKRVSGIAMTQVGGKIEWGGVRRSSTLPTERSDLFSYAAFLQRWSATPSDLFDASVKEMLAAGIDAGLKDEELRIWWLKNLSPEGIRTLESHQRLHDEALQQLNRIESRAVPVPIMTSLPEDKLRSTFILKRGSYLAPGEPAGANVPQILPPMEQASGRDRLALARWLTSPENPLTARVHVNRVWEQLFGTGIVETLEDFGTQGALPSHPALLDWLAVTWQQEDRWSHKALLRRIVTSDTYRRSSKSSEIQRHNDPENRLLSHATRIRLPAEMVRDQALAIGGVLSRKRFGRPVFPPQPDGIWQVVYNGAGWKESKGEDRVRRSLYTFFRRTAPYPTMLTFDGSTRDLCQSRRIRTNTPLQALVMLNDPVAIEAAAGLARIALTATTRVEPRDSIAVAFHRATCRAPTSAELSHLLELFDAQRIAFETEPDSATSFLEGGRWELEEGQDPTVAATMMLIANVLLNLDELLVRG